MSMFKHPEREMLNLVLDGKPFDRFAVTKSSWENFLQRLSEKPAAAIQRTNTHAQPAAIPSQL